jgi:hypothetical protein
MMEVNETNCWYGDCQTDRVGVYGIEGILWIEEDGRKVMGVQATPLCAEHKGMAERDGVIRDIKSLEF